MTLSGKILHNSFDINNYSTYTFPLSYTLHVYANKKKESTITSNTPFHVMLLLYGYNICNKKSQHKLVSVLRVYKCVTYTTVTRSTREDTWNSVTHCIHEVCLVPWYTLSCLCMPDTYTINLFFSERCNTPLTGYVFTRWLSVSSKLTLRNIIYIRHIVCNRYSTTVTFTQHTYGYMLSFFIVFFASVYSSPKTNGKVWPWHVCHRRGYITYNVLHSCSVLFVVLRTPYYVVCPERCTSTYVTYTCY